MQKRFFSTLGLISTVLVLSFWACSAGNNPGDPLSLSDRVAIEWNVLGLNVLREGNISNQFGSRAMATVHVSMYDAVNAIDRRYAPYRTALAAPPGASKAAAAAAAAHEALTSLFPSRAADCDALLAAHLDAVFEGSGKSDGIAFGRQVAAETLAWRSDDGSSTAAAVPFPDGTLPGEWRRTSAQSPLIPGWGAVRPWAMTSGLQFRMPGPPALGSAEYAADLAEVAALGAASSTVRTAEQTTIARFWMAGVPDHLFGIARDMSALKKLNLGESSRLFALLSIALADASISGWDMKYHFGFWRPVTAIREAENDGNPATPGDAIWDSLLPAPAFPEYVSGHSITMSTGLTLLARFHGSDGFSFTRASSTPNLAPRSFTSLSAMAEEVGVSRIYGGLHFSFSNREGLEAGRRLGGYVFDNFLAPL